MGHSGAVPSPFDEESFRVIQLDRSDALEYIMDTYGEEIKRFIYTYVRNYADTDDITQEVFVAIHNKIHTFQGKASLRSWIYSIAINKSKDHLRRWHSRNSRLKEKLKRNSSSSSVNEMSPEQKLIDHNQSKELLQKVMNLTVKYREIIILYYFKELSTMEIANALEVNEATVRTRLKRGREKLKELVERSDRNG
ncbi:sigma-70 family RNA polymerase sigma factor [Salirhabdus sp. Marseille-P4669]|uniref:sigma-70 family RNA polymerase sigma factor n=1 Tax=Salirhabdus sp. Marseille-P4669 TaxID=2042310 RepID=UPI000C7C2182|nr:sigma-70 family RNA polymerase sigma factor [Salirhabdus sp. Marseille-P4669]